MDVGDWAGISVFVRVQLGPIDLEHLDFHALGESTIVWDRSFAPGKHAGVAAGFHVSPFDVEDEVFVLFFRAHDSDGVARANEETVADEPGVFARVDVDPAGEVFAIEEGFEGGDLCGFGVGSCHESGQ